MVYPHLPFKNLRYDPALQTTLPAAHAKEKTTTSFVCVCVCDTRPLPRVCLHVSDMHVCALTQSSHVQFSILVGTLLGHSLSNLKSLGLSRFLKSESKLCSLVPKQVPFSGQSPRAGLPGSSKGNDRELRALS